MSKYSELTANPIITKDRRLIIYIIAIIAIITLTIFQDYIYSQLRNTSFYLSESLTYNTFWAFFVPMGIIALYLYKFINSKKPIFKGIYLIVSGAIFTIIHMLLFTSFFILISNIFFNPPHRFIAIFKSVISNHLYLAFLFYTCGPLLYNLYLKRNEKLVSPQTEYPDQINIKVGASIKSIQTSSIQFIVSEKPYVLIHTYDDKYLQDKSLKDFENELNPTLFFRVHRSAIINKEYITEIVSRQNGDYDAVMTNGQVVRLSRHYRQKWNSLLHLA